METDKRILTDRRKQPTPALSRHTFFGRRQTIRRKSDQVRGSYVDRYNSSTLLLFVLLFGLNILDALFTMMILEAKGVELNPVVDGVMAIYGYNFWMWKYFIVSVSSILLCLHSKLRFVKLVLLGVCTIYTAVVVHEITLLIYQ